MTVEILHSFLAVLTLNYLIAFMLVGVNLFNIPPCLYSPGVVDAGFKISPSWIIKTDTLLDILKRKNNLVPRIGVCRTVGRFGRSDGQGQHPLLFRKSGMIGIIRCCLQFSLLTAIVSSSENIWKP